MSFTFDPKEMADDLVSLSKVGATFLAPQSVGRIDRLAKDLGNGVASGRAKFSWGTAIEAPIQITSSRWWKGDTENFDPLTANISIDYECTRFGETGRLLAKGVTAIRVLGGAEEKGFHFDVEQGGWSEIIDGVARGRAGHPALHVQFYGGVNDIPRLPTLTVHPVDVISLVILELHQKKWREHLDLTTSKTRLRLIPKRQRARMCAALDAWRKKVDSPHFMPVVSLQTPYLEPLTF